MWYNDYTSKWEFGTTSDNVYTRATWEITLNENGGGSIISGKVFYTVKSWEIKTTEEGVQGSFYDSLQSHSKSGDEYNRFHTCW